MVPGSVAVSADGVPLSYVVQGTGTPSLMFVHGWSCDRRYWDRQVDHFAAKCQTVAVDLAGHGASGLGRKDWTMPAFGQDVKAVADTLGLEEIVLVGHSMGGDVVVEAARRMPGRVRGLVWVDTYFRLGTPRNRSQVNAFLAPLQADFVTGARDLVRTMFLPQSDPRLVDWVVADMSAAPADIALAAVEHAIIFEPEVLAGLREVRVPMAAINGKWRPTDVDSLARHGFKVILMSGVGHFPMMEAPERFNRVLSEVIAGPLGIKGLRD